MYKFILPLFLGILVVSCGPSISNSSSNLDSSKKVHWEDFTRWSQFCRLVDPWEDSYVNTFGPSEDDKRVRSSAARLFAGWSGYDCEEQDYKLHERSPWHNLPAGFRSVEILKIFKKARAFNIEDASFKSLEPFKAYRGSQVKCLIISWASSRYNDRRCPTELFGPQNDPNSLLCVGDPDEKGSDGKRLLDSRVCHDYIHGRGPIDFGRDRG